MWISNFLVEKLIPQAYVNVYWHVQCCFCFEKIGWCSKYTNFSSFLDIPHLYFVPDYWFNRRTVKKYSVSSVCYSDSHFSYIPSNVCIISFPSRKIFCLHFQRLLRLMCYTEISMNFSTTWAPGNSYYRFGGLLMCIHRKKVDCVSLLGLTMFACFTGKVKFTPWS